MRQHTNYVLVRGSEKSPSHLFDFQMHYVSFVLILWIFLLSYTQTHLFFFCNPATSSVWWDQKCIRGAVGIDMVPTPTARSDLLDLGRLLNFTATLDQLMIVSLMGS